MIVFWKNDLIVTNTEIHFLPVHKIHNHVCTVYRETLTKEKFDEFDKPGSIVKLKPINIKLYIAINKCLCILF